MSQVRNRTRVYHAASEALELLETIEGCTGTVDQAIRILQAGFRPVCPAYSYRTETHCALDKGHTGPHRWEEP